MPSLFDSWSRGVEQGRENKRQRVLGQNMQSALGGDQKALSSVFGVDPGAGMQVQQYAAQQQKAQKDASVAARDEFGKLSIMLTRMKGAPQAQQVFGQWVKAGKASGLLPAEAPEHFDPEALVAAEHFANALGGQGEQFTLAPGSKRFDASGNVIAEVPFAPQKQDFTLYDSADGPVWLPKPGAGGMPAPKSGGGQMVMDDALIQAIMQQESGGNPNAVSPAGARGLMQLMPGTARDPGFGIQPARDDSPAENMRVGTEYFRAMLQKYGGNVQMALAAYNAGPGRVDGALAQAGNDPQAALSRLPAETRNYVPSVLSRAGQGGGVGAIPITGVRPKPGAGKAAPSGYQWSADGQSLVPIPGGPADRKNNPTPADQAKGEMSMRKELADLLKSQRTVTDMYRKVESAASNPSAPNDLALIFAYMKMLDPGSVVREQEFANAQNAAGVPDRVRNAYNKALRGERLNDSQRREFLSSAQQIFNVAQQETVGQTRQFAEMADDYGYDPVRATGSKMGSAQFRQQFDKATDLLQEAREAIASGKDPQAVRQRLIDMGFSNIAGRL